MFQHHCPPNIITLTSRSANDTHPCGYVKLLHTPIKSEPHRTHTDPEDHPRTHTRTHSLAHSHRRHHHTTPPPTPHGSVSPSTSEQISGALLHAIPYIQISPHTHIHNAHSSHTPANQLSRVFACVSAFTRFRPFEQSSFACVYGKKSSSSSYIVGKERPAAPRPPLPPTPPPSSSTANRLVTSCGRRPESHRKAVMCRI